MELKWLNLLNLPMPIKRGLYMRLMDSYRLAFCGDMLINYEFQDHRELLKKK